VWPEPLPPEKVRRLLLPKVPTLQLKVPTLQLRVLTKVQTRQKSTWDQKCFQ
jgi:hypothetical protein